MELTEERVREIVREIVREEVAAMIGKLHDLSRMEPMSSPSDGTRGESR